MQKLLGSILILAGSFGYGFFKSSAYRNRIRDLVCCKNIGIYLKSQKKYTKLPFDVLLRECAREQNSYFADRLIGIADKMKQQENHNLEKIWKLEFADETGELYLTKKDQDLFAKLGKAILEETGTEEGSRFYFYLMDKELEQLLREQKNIQKLYQTLSVSVGILLVLVLM